MSRAPRLSVLAPQNATRPSPDISAPCADPAQRKSLRLLRPGLVEAAVVITDFLLIVTAGVLGNLAYYWIAGSPTNVASYSGMGIIVATNFAALMIARHNHHLKCLIRFNRQARETIIIWSATCGLLASAAFTMKISSDFSRGAVILFFAGGLATLLCWRYVVARFISRSLANGRFGKKPIIVIAEEGQCSASRPLTELLSYGYDPVATYEISREEITFPGITTSLSDKLADIVHVARHESIQDIYLLLRWRNDRTIDGILDALAVLPVSVHLLPDANAARFLEYPTANVGNTWTAVLRRTPLTRTELAAKRCFDVALATAGLLTVMPLMLITAVLIKLDSAGPVLFRQKRNGFNNLTFEIFKFRTMHVLENGAAIKQATRDDPRVTRLGRRLRKSSIDELPQLFNVIRGDMSLVGPRPHATSHNSEYEKLIANYAFRHHVKPGLTGWAQVNGCRGETRQIEQMKKRVEHDLWYINNWSPWLDLKIVVRTIVVALRQDGAY